MRGASDGRGNARARVASWGGLRRPRVLLAGRRSKNACGETMTSRDGIKQQPRSSRRRRAWGRDCERVWPGCPAVELALRCAV